MSIWKVQVKVAQSCPTLFNPIDYTVHGILQARILEWVAVPFSRGSSWPRDRTGVSCIAGRFFTSWAIKWRPSPSLGSWAYYHSENELLSENRTNNNNIFFTLFSALSWGANDIISLPKLSLERSSLVTGEGICGGSSDAEKPHSSVCTLPSTPDEQPPVWGASSITTVQHFSRCAQALSMSFRLDHGEAKVAQSCPPLCSPMDCCLPGSSVHGIL